jgi:predicted AlkP superfamily pyrophosphatase or phosphodiesterase
MKFIKPNFSKSNLNISATLAEFLGAPNNNSTLPVLKRVLSKGYKNVVFICLDGFGIIPMKNNLKKDDFLWKNTRQTLTSTFPATTTNATISLLNNQLPLEHGWFGWSMYFENVQKNINIFLNTDSWTGEKVGKFESPLAEFDYYFDNSNSEYEINTIFPAYVSVKSKERNHVYKTLDELFENIKTICNKSGKQFIYSYSDEPDHTMHEFGMSSAEAKDLMCSISSKIQKLSNEVKDTMIIITADHGQVDITKSVEMFKDEHLLNLLETYPYLEQRAMAFRLKKEKDKEFVKHFKKIYGKDFKVFKTKKLIEKNYFGRSGDKANLLGDYIAVSRNGTSALLSPKTPNLKGNHGGLTTAEMKVPLIIIET